MTHLDDGRLHALMDEELGDADILAVRRHLGTCDACKDRMAELGERSALVARALGHLDTAAPPAGARDAVLERLGSLSGAEQADPVHPLASPERSLSKNRARVFRMPLARAAILVLFLSGSVATALPASPVRGWIAAGWALVIDLFDPSDDSERPIGPDGEAPARIQDGVDAQSGTPAGVRLDAAEGEIIIVLSGVSSGTLIVVRMVPGRVAGAFADDPATFRTSEGRIEVIGAVGRVLVDLPQDAASASIVVNGGIYVRKEGDRIDAPGPIEAISTEEIRRRVP